VVSGPSPQRIKVSLLVGEISLAARREPAIEHRREDMAAGSHKLRMRESFRGD